MRSPSQIREATVRQWIDSATGDLEWAELGARQPRLRGIAQIGFHAQQAIEKLLKGLLAAHDVVPEDHHSLARLISQLRLLDRVTADAVSPAAALTPYAVQYRYPPRNPGAPHRLTREEVLRDLETARTVFPVLKDAIERRLERLREAAHGSESGSGGGDG